MTQKIEADVEADIDRLHQLPLDQFVQARNELASRERASGRHSVAIRVQSLAKPSVSAWAVNQLYWRARGVFDALMKAGRQLRAAQEATLAGRAAGVRDAGKRRDVALVPALERTLDLLQQAGHPATPAMRLRIATDLEALAVYGGPPPAVAAGRLVEDLDPPGFEVFEGMRLRAEEAKAEAEPRRTRKRAAAQVVSFEAIAEARRAVANAERTAAEQRAAAHRAESELEQARADLKAAHAEAARAKSAWEDARRHVEQAERRVPEHEREAERARRAAEESSEAIDRARAALEDMKKSRKK